MHTFYRGWRRKLGCVALVMACAFTAGWVRSRTANDYVIMPTNSAGYFVGSDSLGLCWIKSENLDYPEVWYELYGPGVSLEFNTPYQRPIDHNAETTCSQWLGFQAIQINSNILRVRDRKVKLVLPYWSVVLPLTLLSAYLLLSRPRPVKPPVQQSI